MKTHKTLSWGELGKIRLRRELYSLNSERANAKSNKEQIAVSDKIIVLRRKMHALGIEV